MKRFCFSTVALFLVVVLLFTSQQSLAEGKSPRALGSVHIEYLLTQRSGSIIGGLSATEPAGHTITLTIAIQYQSSSGTWYTKTSATAQGTYIDTTCTATSGTRYRLRYSYKLYDETSTLIDSGSGYSNVIQAT